MSNDCDIFAVVSSKPVAKLLVVVVGGGGDGLTR